MKNCQSLGHDIYFANRCIITMPAVRMGFAYQKGRALVDHHGFLPNGEFYRRTARRPSGS
jgi:hypothetical protein